MSRGGCFSHSSVSIKKKKKEVVLKSTFIMRKFKKKIPTHIKISVWNIISNWRPFFFSSVQNGFRKGKGTRDQMANIRWIMEKAREFQKNIYFCFIDYAKAFDWITANCGKLLQRWDHLTCLLRNLYAGQEATVRTGHGTTD